MSSKTLLSLLLATAFALVSGCASPSVTSVSEHSQEPVSGDEDNIFNWTITIKEDTWTISSVSTPAGTTTNYLPLGKPEPVVKYGWGYNTMRNDTVVCPIKLEVHASVGTATSPFVMQLANGENLDGPSAESSLSSTTGKQEAVLVVDFYSERAPQDPRDQVYRVWISPVDSVGVIAGEFALSATVDYLTAGLPSPKPQCPQVT